MAFVNMKASAFLVRKEGFDTETSSVKPVRMASIRLVDDQKNGFFMLGTPPNNQIGWQSSIFGESIRMDYA